jgi:lysophospholipase L1-like esterase
MQILFNKKTAFIAFAILIFTILFLVVAEGAARLYIHLRYGVPGHRYGIYMADRELGSMHRPSSYNLNTTINNWGFRNTEDIYKQKPKNARRIYCSGGSATFCFNLPTEQSWPSLLQAKLRRIPGHEYDQVLNAGEISFAIAHEFSLAKRHIPLLQPDIVILYGQGINEGLAFKILMHNEGKDFSQLLAQQQWGVFPRNLDQGRLLKRSFVLVKFYDYVIKSWFRERLSKRFRQASKSPGIPYRPHPWLIANFDNTLRAYLAFLRQNGCQIIIVRYGDNGINNWYLDNYIRFFRERASLIGREEGAIICDLAKIIQAHPRREDLYSDGGVHVTAEGAELVSDTLLTTIKNEYIGH